MKNKLKRVLNNYYILSFIFGALAYYMFLSYSQMAGGKYILLEGDTLDGVIPSYMTFYDNLLSGKGIFYTWCSGLGINSYINLAGMMIFNVSMPFYLIFHNFDYSIITVITLVLKAGLSSVSFYFYMDKIWKVSGLRSIVFSVCYSMCAFWVVYVPAILNFSDAIYMLPLILYFVSLFAEKGYFKVMCFAYLYLFLNFFYSAYIVGFFSLFYLILYMFLINRYTLKTMIKKLVMFGICIIITAGISAVILYPMAYFLFSKYAEDATSMTEGMPVNLLDIYNQLYVGQVCGYYTVYPYIYCGLPVLLLFPLYFLNKKIDKKEKLLFFILLTLMIVSCFILPLYLFWHCMDAPDGDPYRFSFIISFLLCFVACRQSVYLNEIKRITLIGIVIFNCLIYLLCRYIQPLYQEEYLFYPENTWKYLIINGVFMLAYLIWLLIFRKMRESTKKNRLGMKMLLLLIVIGETVLNGYSGYYKNTSLWPKNNGDTYRLWRNTIYEALDKIGEDRDSFYRISSVGDYIVNAPLYFNYNGISTFSNMENYEVRRALGNLGLMTSPRDIFCNGLTDFTKMILADRYEIQNVGFGFHRDYVADFDQHAEVIKNDNCLSLGFLVNKDVIDFAFPGRNQFENINALASCMTGNEQKLYEMITSGFDVKEAGINLYQDEDGKFIFVLESEEDDTGLMFFTAPIDERDAYIQFDYGWSAYDKKSPIICDGLSGVFDQFEVLSGSFIKKMIRLNDGFEIAIFMTDGLYTEVLAPENIYFAYYNEDKFLDVYKSLADGQMNISDYKNGYVHGRIDINDDDKVLFTSIPYDEGWNITVNGEETEPIKLLDGAFIGLELPKGSYDIEFKYSVPGLGIGALISIISIILLIILFRFSPDIKAEYRILISEEQV